MANKKDLNLVAIAQRFSSEDQAREYLERLRWPEGPTCPHCSCAEVYRLTARPDSKRPGRKGLLKCKQCRKQFTAKVGTIFEDSHIPLSKWLSAIYLLCSSKKGMSAHQLHRMLGVTYKSAWFMAHRIRYAMAQPPLRNKLTGIVEADECYIRRKLPWEKHRGRPSTGSRMRPVVALVERGGNVRSFHVDRVTAENLGQVIRDNVEVNTRLIDRSVERLRACRTRVCKPRDCQPSRKGVRPRRRDNKHG